MDKLDSRREHVVAPVLPTLSASVRLRPIGLRDSRITGGMWASRRATNHSVSLPHGAAQLERVGNIMNLRLAAGVRGTYQGGADDSGTTAPFLDSDVHKWLEAVGWELSQVYDPELLALAEPLIELIEKAQREDGYVDTFFQVLHPGREFTDMQWGHEMYVAGHLIQAAVAWYRGLGDDRLLRVATRFVERIWRELGPGRRELVDGHPEIEMALVELFRTTAQARYLELAQLLVERRGNGLLGKGRFGDRYWQDHEPVRTAREPVGHAVRQVYLDCGVADVAIETGDSELLEAVLQRWEALRSSRMYLTGGLGSRHRDESIGAAFELPPDRAYGETCASIGSVMLAWRLLLGTGQARFADVIERTSYNGVLPGVADDGSHFFYSNPLQRRSRGPEVLGGAATTRRAEWFEVACCPPNVMRFLATFPDQVAAADENGIHLLQFATGTVVADLSVGRAGFDVTTDYPWGDTVEVAIAQSPPTPWSLSIRVPAWCPAASLVLHGSTVLAESGPGTIEVTRPWATGDRLTLRFAMEPRVTVPDPRIDALRRTIALERGPLVYAVEDADLPAGVSVESIEVDAAPAIDATAAIEPELEGATRLAFDAHVREDPEVVEWPYTSQSIAAPALERSHARTRVPIQAIPYLAWARRPGLGMRVWLPVRPCASHTAILGRDPGSAER